MGSTFLNCQIMIQKEPAAEFDLLIPYRIVQNGCETLSKFARAAKGVESPKRVERSRALVPRLVCDIMLMLFVACFSEPPFPLSSQLPRDGAKLRARSASPINMSARSSKNVVLFLDLSFCGSMGLCFTGSDKRAPAQRNKRMIAHRVRSSNGVTHGLECSLCGFLRSSLHGRPRAFAT